jgi:hypothetical protein
MNKLIPLLICLATAPAFSSTTVQQERLFDIEVLFFKRAVSPENTRENWPNEMPAVDITIANKFDDDEFRTDNEIRMLSSESYALTEQREKLDDHAAFEVLMHTAWRQNDLNRRDAPIFRIQAGKDYSDSFNVDGSQKSQDPTVYENIEPQIDLDSPDSDLIVEEEIDNSLYELDGTLQVYVQHYLYAEVAIDLKAPSVREVTIIEPEIISDDTLVLDESIFTTDTDLTNSEELEVSPTEVTLDESAESDETIQVGFLEEIAQPEVIIEEFLKNHRFEQKRKMRSSETHFLDHPLMGMIIQVRRVPPEEVERIIEERLLAKEVEETLTTAP